MERFGFSPATESVTAITDPTGILGLTADAACHTLQVKVENWCENSLETEAPIGALETLRSTMPDDCLKPIMFTMELLAEPASVLWTLKTFRCIAETIAACIPSLLSDHTLPERALSATSLIEPEHPDIRVEVAVLTQARDNAKKHVTALNEGISVHTDSDLMLAVMDK